MIIDVSGLNFSYGETTVLHEVNLQIAKNEVVALLGPNGAGKTTLLELILGQLTPNKGSISVLGKSPLNQTADFWKEIGIVQQYWRDHPKWTVKRQLEWVRSLYLASNKQPKTVEQALEEVDLTGQANQTLTTLSGGQRRRADFAVATMGNPKLLILDEPTTGLDPAARNEIHQLLDQATLNGATVLMTTHDLNEAEKVASRIIVLTHYHIVADGTADELRANNTPLAQISWRDANGNIQVHATDHVEKFVAELPLQEISELTITRPTLESAYLDLMGK